MVVQTWVETFVFSLQDLWLRLVAFLPTIVGAFLVFVIGWIIAITLGRATVRLMKALQVDKLFDQLGVVKQVHKAGLAFEVSDFLGALVKWFLIIVTFLAAVDILGLAQLSIFVVDVLLYIPNVIVAALILLVAAVLANFLEKLVKTSVRVAEVGPANLMGTVVRWGVWGFALIAAISQLGIAPEVVQTLLIGFVAMLALAGGLAFGLGGQGVAREVWESIRKNVVEK